MNVDGGLLYSSGCIIDICCMQSYASEWMSREVSRISCDYQRCKRKSGAYREYPRHPAKGSKHQTSPIPDYTNDSLFSNEDHTVLHCSLCTGLISTSILGPLTSHLLATNNHKHFPSSAPTPSLSLRQHDTLRSLLYLTTTTEH